MSHSPGPKILAQTQSRHTGLELGNENLGKSISIAANVQNLFFSVLDLKSSIIRKRAPLGNVSRRMSDVFDFRGRVEKTETCQRKESFRR